MSRGVVTENSGELILLPVHRWRKIIHGK